MNKVILLLFVILLTGCISESDGIQPRHSSSVRSIEEALNIYIKMTKNNGTRSEEKAYALTPYVIEDDTVMYVSQYEEGGWELYSADMRYPLVLLSQDVGIFDEVMSIPAIRDCVETMACEIKNAKARAQINTEDVDDSWSWINPTYYGNRNDSSPVDYPDYDHGQWDVIEWKDLDPIVEERDHILRTQWGDGHPWNMYINKVNNNNCAAGTESVAIAQYLFYIHSKIGMPETIPSQARMFDDNTYVYYSFTADGWDNMALTVKDPYNKIKTAAVLIGYVSQSIGTLYGESYSNANMDYAVNTFLAKYAAEQFEKVDYTVDRRILSELKNGNPVIAWGKCSKTNNREYAFIIDAYKTTTRRAVITYGWNGLMKSGRDPNMRDHDGNIIEYGIKKVADWSSTISYYKMNWGFGGLGNDAECHAAIWSPDLAHIDITINKDRKLYINNNTTLYEGN